MTTPEYGTLEIQLPDGALIRYTPAAKGTAIEAKAVEVVPAPETKEAARAIWFRSVAVAVRSGLETIKGWLPPI